MRSSILARIPGFRQRIIPEPRVSSRGSQARGTRLPPGKCDRMNDMQTTENCLLLKCDSILLCASSLICIRQKHKIADKIAGVNKGN